MAWLDRREPDTRRPSETLVGIMVQSGIVESSARAEVDATLRSPYLRGVSRLHNRLAKRDWVLGIQSRLNHLAQHEVPQGAAVRRGVPQRALLAQPAGHHHRHAG
jgi:hypothetical protein